MPMKPVSTGTRLRLVTSNTPKRDARISARCDAETAISKQILQSLLKRADGAKKDSDKEQRLYKHECKACHYARWHPIAGRAFTTFRCFVCDEDHDHPSTAVPRACYECAKSISCCMRCLGNMD